MDSVVQGCKAIFGGISRLFAARHERLERAPGRRPQILAIVSPGPNLAILKTQSRHSGWSLSLSDAGRDAARLRGLEVSPIIIYDRELSPSHWREMVRRFAREVPRPYVILLSPNADANLWDELQRLGGSDILRAPIDRDSLLGAVERGWQFWRNQQQLRTPSTRP